MSWDNLLITNEVVVNRCEKIGQSRWAKTFLFEKETLLVVIEDGAGRDVQQLCRPPYLKNWSVVTEVLLSDLGLALLQNLQALRLHLFCGQFAWWFPGINELLFTAGRHSFSCS